MLFDFVDEWISVWTSGFEKSLVHLTSGSESLAKPLRWGRQPIIWPNFPRKLHENERNWTQESYPI